MAKQERVEHKHVFSEDEILQVSRELAKKNRDFASLEDEKKAAMAEYKAKMDAVHSEVNLLSQHVTNGYKHVRILCEVKKNTSRGELIYYSVDTGELIQRRRMQRDDYQLDIEDESV